LKRIHATIFAVSSLSKTR